MSESSNVADAPARVVHPNGATPEEVTRGLRDEFPPLPTMFLLVLVLLVLATNKHRYVKNNQTMMAM
jgi:hypothetical protein